MLVDCWWARDRVSFDCFRWNCVWLLVLCDESGTNSTSDSGFGAIWGLIFFGCFRSEVAAGMRGRS